MEKRGRANHYERERYEARQGGTEICYPPLPLQQSRRKFSDAIRDADGWLEQARKDVKKRDYKGAREMVLCACFALDNAMQYETEPRE
jgi:hypothetical protein